MGSILSTPVTAQHLQRCQSSHLQSGFAEVQGWRDDHEDSHIMDCSWGGDATRRGLFAVFDGHGGSSAAEFAAVYLPLKMSPKKALTDDDIIKYFVECDDAYRQSPDNKAGAAASLLTTEKLPNGKYRVKFANAGDSRAILISTARPLPDKIASRSLEDGLHKKREGELFNSPEHLNSPDGLHFVSDDFDCGVVLSTIDHKPNYPSEKARIEAAGGFVSTDNPARLQGMLALSRMIGDFNYKMNPSLPVAEQMGSVIPEIFTSEEAQEGDIVVVACDGIFDVLSNNELARQVRLRLASQSGSIVPDLAKIASDIVTLCLNQLDSKDNMSLCIILLKGLSPEQQVLVPKKVEDELLIGDFARYAESLSSDSMDKRTRKAYEDFFVKVGYFKAPNACNVCHRFFKQMSSCPCKKAIYCDHHCQKLDWKTHRKSCANNKAAKSESPKNTRNTK